MFQPTRPHGARPATPSEDCAHRGFNPRARMGRDPDSYVQQWYKAKFQPTRPHGARLCVIPPAHLSVLVSTHAPAWGATGRMLEVTPTGVFQPTRPHGARPPCNSRPCAPSSSFNPRARMGRDSRSISVYRLRRCFNPRARMGRDRHWPAVSACR